MAVEHTVNVDDPFHHVRDATRFELPRGIEIDLPSIFGFQITKYMVLQVVAGLIVLWIGRGLAKRVASGEPVRGRWWNFWEALALFIRDEVVRPTIGTGHHGQGHGDAHTEDPHLHVTHGAEGSHHGQNHSLTHGAVHHGEHPTDDAKFELTHPAAAAHEHRADQYLPFVWTCFFYVLICNLLGAFPMLGSATAEINVTAALALCTIGFVILSGSRESGAVGFWKSLVPGMDLPPVMKVVLIPLIWVIELVGFAIKHGVLAVRLFANIMAGHTVIAVILGFIALAASDWLYYLVLPSSIIGQVAIGLLELFVAFLQAYIFAFLASLFISAAVNPH